MGCTSAFVVTVGQRAIPSTRCGPGLSSSHGASWRTSESTNCQVVDILNQLKHRVSMDLQHWFIVAYFYAAPNIFHCHINYHSQAWRPPVTPTWPCPWLPEMVQEGFGRGDVREIIWAKTWFPTLLDGWETPSSSKRLPFEWQLCGYGYPKRSKSLPPFTTRFFQTFLEFIDSPSSFAASHLLLFVIHIHGLWHFEVCHLWSLRRSLRRSSWGEFHC